VAKFVIIQGCCAVFPTTETKTYDTTDQKNAFCNAIHRENIFSCFFDTPSAELNKSRRAEGLLQQNELMFRKTFCVTRRY
jgi:hypothetical protein